MSAASLNGYDPQLAKYHQVADALRRAIQDGRLPVGARLPAVADLCEWYETSRVTVQHALSLLRAEGLIRTRQGCRTIVTARPGWVPTPQHQRNGHVPPLGLTVRLRPGVRFGLLTAPGNHQHGPLAAVRVTWDQTSVVIEGPPAALNELGWALLTAARRTSRPGVAS